MLDLERCRAEAADPATPADDLDTLAVLARQDRLPELAPVLAANPSLPERHLLAMVKDGLPEAWSNPQLPLVVLLAPESRDVRAGARAVVRAIIKAPAAAARLGAGASLLRMVMQTWWAGSIVPEELVGHVISLAEGPRRTRRAWGQAARATWIWVRTAWGRAPAATTDLAAFEPVIEAVLDGTATNDGALRVAAKQLSDRKDRDFADGLYVNDLGRWHALHSCHLLLQAMVERGRPDLLRQASASAAEILLYTAPSNALMDAAGFAQGVEAIRGHFPTCPLPEALDDP